VKVAVVNLVNALIDYNVRRRCR